jgi:radical SAM superfamily enzyme YgiQ (UPF0313 family)
MNGIIYFFIPCKREFDRNMRSVLIGTNIEGNRQFYNLAIGYLKAYSLSKVKNAEIYLKQIPAQLKKIPNHSKYLESILAEDPEIIGLSGYCWNYNDYKILVPEIKKLSPGVRIILGGPLSTFYGLQMMKEANEIDAAVIGEGEETFSEILQKNYFENIKGIIYRDRIAGLKITAARSIRTDLNQIPSPYLEKIIEPAQNEIFYEFSRGCFNKCRQCPWNSSFGNKAIRHRSAEKIESEIRWGYNNRYKKAYIIDSLINYDNFRMKIICKKLKKIIPEGKMDIGFEFHSNLFRTEQIGYLKGIKLNLVISGMESLNRQAVSMYGKPSADWEKFKRVLKELNFVNKIAVNVILGLIGDNLKSFMETMEFLFSISRDNVKIHIYRMVVPHGSYFHKNREKFQLRIAGEGVPCVLGSQTFPEKDMESAVEFILNHPLRDAVEFMDGIWTEKT